jgi:hypothetical protein
MPFFPRNLSITVFAVILPVTLLLPGCTSTSTAQVPSPVSQAFDAKYPRAKPQWEAKPIGYEAVFTQDGQEYEAEYSSTGEWLETEYEVRELQFSPAGTGTLFWRSSKSYRKYSFTEKRSDSF